MMINENADNYDRETSEYIVAYLDLLGVTTRMKNNINAQKVAMNKLHNLYNFNMNSAREIAMDGYRDIQFKIFSDNIIIAKKLSTDLKTRMLDIKCLLNCVSNFQCTSVKDCVGWLVRGGISIGDLYIDETMVWGQALLKSYELENNIAIFPRIVIDSNIICELQKDEELVGYVSKDFDNMYFLNYLYIQHFGGRFLENGFKLMLDELNGKYSDRVYQKLCWHMNYVNKELDKKTNVEKVSIDCLLNRKSRGIEIKILMLLFSYKPKTQFNKSAIRQTTMRLCSSLMKNIASFFVV